MKKNKELDLMDLNQLEIEPLDDAVLASITGGCTGTCSCPSCSEPNTSLWACGANGGAA